MTRVRTPPTVRSRSDAVDPGGSRARGRLRQHDFRQLRGFQCAGSSRGARMDRPHRRRRLPRAARPCCGAPRTPRARRPQAAHGPCRRAASARLGVGIRGGDRDTSGHRVRRAARGTRVEGRARALRRSAQRDLRVAVHRGAPRLGARLGAPSGGRNHDRDRRHRRRSLGTGSRREGSIGVRRPLRAR